MRYKTLCFLFYFESLIPLCSFFCGVSLSVLLLIVLTCVSLPLWSLSSLLFLPVCLVQSQNLAACCSLAVARSAFMFDTVFLYFLPSLFALVVGNVILGNCVCFSYKEGFFGYSALGCMTLHLKSLCIESETHFTWDIKPAVILSLDKMQC